jgi:hypothetical protein
VQRHAADHLHVEVAQAERAPRCFAHRGKCFRQQLLEGFSGAEALAELAGLLAELGIAHALHAGLELVDAGHAGHDAPHALQFAVVLRADYFADEREDHDACVFQHGRGGRDVAIWG